MPVDEVDEALSNLNPALSTGKHTVDWEATLVLGGQSLDPEFNVPA
jgi:hypothetical protein